MNLKTLAMDNLGYESNKSRETPNVVGNSGALISPFYDFSIFMKALYSYYEYLNNVKTRKEKNLEYNNT